MQAPKSVEEICQLIERYQIMSSKDYATMHGAAGFAPIVKRLPMSKRSASGLF